MVFSDPQVLRLLLSIFFRLISYFEIEANWLRHDFLTWIKNESTVVFRVYLPSIAVFWLVPSLDLLFFSWLQLFHGNNWFRGITEKGATDIGMAGQCIFFGRSSPRRDIHAGCLSVPARFFFLVFSSFFLFRIFVFPSILAVETRKEKKKMVGLP